ncbi:MAG: chromosome segregation protein SMC, partial [Pusillimonas sp.]|nr:chromosome segregation protein SMC [Pusillimonas sp.]
MRLTQIKLAGFKSFVEPTVIPTPSQLVGVVGPNGCGKSNIIDAVRWVLGETRASELRGESMQDVIFNGSGQRKASARASVELVFDNDDGRASGQWTTYSEIAVRRVLTRDGTSSYYINNQQVRRRDIHDIFLGTGLGTRGYAIIGQGMINRLIEARPEELRVYLEEAAGVSRYKERRRETENRLADTRENLSRVEDILRELDTQLGKLEAQAEVAARYRSLQQDGERKQHVLWLLKEEGARGDQKARFVAIEKTQTELEAAAAGLRRIESELESRRQAHYAAGDRVHAAQGKLYEAGAQVSRLEAEIRHVVDSRARVQVRRTHLETQQQEWQAQQIHCEEQIAASEAALEEAVAQTEELRIQTDEVAGALPAIEDRVRSAGAARDDMRSVLSRIEQDLALAAQAQRDADRQLEALVVRRERLNATLRSLDAPDPARIEQLAGNMDMLSAQQEEAQARLLELEERLPELDEARRDAQRSAQEDAAALARLEARLTALEKLQQDVQTQEKLQPWLEKHGLASMPRLWQHLSVESGWEPALEAALGDVMGALEMRRLKMAQAFVNDPPPSKLAFYQRPIAGKPPASNASLRSLSTLLRTNDAGLRSLLERWLANVYIADSVEHAMRLLGDLPEGPACFVVPSGHVVDAHSIRYYAPDTDQAGMLARQKEIVNLHKEIKARQLMADQAIAAVARAEAAWKEVGQALPPTRTRVAEMTRRLHDLQLEHSRLVQLAEQSGQRATQIRDELTEIAAQTETLKSVREEAETRFQSLDESLAEHQGQYEEAQMSGEALANEAERARQRVRELERRAHESEFTERTLQTRIDDLRRNFTLAREQGRKAIDELASLQSELTVLDASAAQAGLQDALEERAACEEVLSQARIELDNLAAGLRDADEKRLENERQLEPLRAKITELQLQEQAARLAVEQFSEQLETAQVNRDVLRRFLEEQPESWQRVGWLQSEVQRISREVDGLGAVNLAALEELEQARERKSYLDSQHADLCSAIETLEDAIRKIDRETRALLQETFDTVNLHFGKLFPRLFGGGQAKLIITGEEILDAGVQVMAQPPGKRNSTIHLLSEDEK